MIQSNWTSRYADTDLLMPLVQTKALQAVLAANKAGHNIDIFETWRHPARQENLYAQGRTAPGAKVTNAKPWASWHQYGLAFDIAARHPKTKVWTWDFDVEEVIPFFLDQGLESLRPYESCHFQLTSGLSLTAAKSLVQSGGLQALWLEVKLRISAGVSRPKKA